MNILTFDIEDWYHILQKYPDDILKKWDKYEDRINFGLDKIINSLLEHNISATFFVLGYIADKHPNIVKRIHEHGFEIGAHSYMHKVAYHQTKDEFENDLNRCIKSLESITGQKVISYRAPGFSVKKNNVWVFDVLAEHGIKNDASIFPALREDGGFISFNYSEPVILKRQDYMIKEFPMSVNRFLGLRFTATGGGYFRFFPYKFIQNIVKRSKYTMTYFHPRDFDPDQPMLEGLSLKRKFKSYYNLSKAYPKYQRLIKDFDFMDISEASKIINWDKAPVVNLDTL